MSKLYNNVGKTINTGVPAMQKKAFGLYGNVYSYPNAGRYRNRFYTLNDTSVGLDTLSRELLVRWSREMYGQLPFIKSAVRALADFSIGQAYQPQYIGKNNDWWKEASSWLNDEWYQNCSVRGSHYDFQTSLKLESQLIDIDGDFLIVFGTENGFPKFQIIQNNRIKSALKDGEILTEGPMKGMLIGDGIYYTPQGKAVGYHVQNSNNMVNSTLTPSNGDLILSSKDANLVLDPEYIDKLRGVPAIGSAILQALSIQELDQYLMEKIKIESTIALINKTPSGEAPQELQNTLEQLYNQTNGNLAQSHAVNTHAVEIRQGAEVRYIHAEGGDIKTLSSNSPANETAEFMTRLETQILSCIGVPHTLVFSVDKVSGRVTSGVAEIFRSAIKRRQGIMDKSAILRVSWALAKAMDAGFIPRNDDENISKVITMSHPKEFSLDAKYDNQIIIDQYESGFSTLNDATTKLFNKTAEQTINTQAEEQILFYTKAKEVAERTGVELNTVVAGWRYQQKITAPPPPPQPSKMEDTE